MAVSGVGVTVASAGALLIYAGLKDVNPLDALRSIASGRPAPIPAPKDTRAATTTYSDASYTGGASPAGPGYPALLTAAMQFKDDQYSQARRWQPGYSDCSSFVGKAFKANGVKPPGASTCVEYLAWRDLRKVPQDRYMASVVGPGDLLISTSHMAIVIDSRTAIGQQNTREDVRVDTWENIMFGTGAYGVYHYSPVLKLEA